MKTKSKSLITIFGLLFSVFTYAQVPVYNSYPSAAATIFLDFDGHYVNGTSWNYSGPISCGPANMTNAQIAEIFNRVAEDYRPFNVNITTDSTVFLAAPVNRRMRVILTVTSDWYGSAGGVSFVNSFSWADNTPCFVFTALLRYNTKNVAEAASHEAGHTLGLNHQSSYDPTCSKTAEYNAGVGSGEISWAPIMGVGYYRNLTLWHNGSNPWGCSNYQDDLGIITGSTNGFGYRTDDFAEKIGNSASQADFSNNQFNISGIIERIDDKDVFKFTMPDKGFFHLDANPFNVGNSNSGSNLDLKIDLMTNSQNVVGSYNPDLLLNATIDTTLDAGTYYLRVQSMGNEFAPDYATLGSYNLKGSYSVGSVLALHRLELRGSSEGMNHKLSWIIEADENVVSQNLQASTDGRVFETISSFSAADRRYSYAPTSSRTLYYRLNVKFDNNKEYLSNTIAIPATNAGRPTLTGNLVQNTVQVKSPAPYNYTLVDLSGRPVANGKLTQGLNSIGTFSLSRGMYIIQFTNGEEQYAEKFMKQ